jgi:hypothetical protein
MDKISFELPTQQWSVVLQGLDELPRKIGNEAFVSVYNQLKALAEKQQAPTSEG